MLKRTFCISIITSFFLLICLITNFFIIKKSDYKEYAKLIDKKVKLTQNASIKKQKASQFRKNVQKDLYLVDDNNRRHFRLFCNETEIFLIPNKNSLMLQEKLTNLKCWIQDKILEQSYEVKYFEAKTGKYTFPSHSFFANNVDILFFHQNINKKFSEIDEKEAYMSGFAKDINFTLSEKKPIFNANDFQATFKLE